MKATIAERQNAIHLLRAGQRVGEVAASLGGYGNGVPGIGRKGGPGCKTVPGVLSIWPGKHQKRISRRSAKPAVRWKRKRQKGWG